MKNKTKTAPAKKLTAKNKRILKSVEFLQNYFNTYTTQTRYLEYSEKTLLDDCLYGIGVALWGKEMMFAQGYEKTKAKILEFLKK